MITEAQVNQQLQGLDALVRSLAEYLPDLPQEGWYTEIVAGIRSINRHNPTIAHRLLRDAYAIVNRYVDAKREIMVYYGTDMLSDAEEAQFDNLNEDIEQELYDDMAIQRNVIASYNTPQMLQTMSYNNPSLRNAMQYV